MNSAAELVLLGKAAEMLQLCCAAFLSGERLWVGPVLCSQLQHLRGPQHQDCAVFILRLHCMSNAAGIDLADQVWECEAWQAVQEC